MKSFCIKTNNIEIIEYLQTQIEELELKNIYISRNQFKIYKNIIVHYLGENKKKFLYEISCILASCIEEFYEKRILRSYIDYNYFYFEDFEREIILRICLKIIQLQEEQFKYKNEILKELIFDYLLESKSIVLDGIVNFRIKEYKEILEYIVEIAVTNYIRYI
ncbi:MAG: sporulation protein YtxC [Candidatus Scatovivens sp.]